MTIYAKIVGTGSCLPPRRVTNQDMTEILAARGLETSDEWIVSRSGISARHYAEEGVKSSDLAVSAAQQALGMAKLLPNDIDLIVLATSTPDHLGGFPSTACVVQDKLGIKNGCPAMDVQAVCAGFMYALSIAEKFIKSGQHKNVLVLGAEVFSRILNFDDRTTSVLFGDGAGAVVLSASQEPGILSTVLHADGSYRNILCVNGHLQQGSVQGDPFLTMDGQAVFKLAVNVLDKVAHEALAKAQLTSDQIDWLVPHQANIRIMQSTAKKMGMPLERVVATVAEHGNTSAASIPLALDIAVRDGRIQAGQTILMEGVGGGFTWGAAIIRF